MTRMRVLAVVPRAISHVVAASLNFEDFVEYAVHTDDEAAQRAVTSGFTPNLILGGPKLLTWAQAGDLRNVPFVYLDETGILSEEVALHAGAREYISLRVPMHQQLEDWWHDTLHRMVQQYRPAEVIVERLKPDVRANMIVAPLLIDNAYTRDAVRVALTAAFAEIDALHARIERLEKAKQV